MTKLLIKKKGKVVKNLYGELGIVSSVLVKVPNRNAEVGFGLCVDYNRDTKQMKGDFVQIKCLCRTGNDTRISTFATSQFSNELTDKLIDELATGLKNLTKNQKDLFTAYKTQHGLVKEADKDARIKLFEAEGYTFEEVAEDSN